VECQEKVSATYQDQQKWTKMSILSTARMGRFSSDRAVEEYCLEIWKSLPIEIDLEKYAGDYTIFREREHL
jgi:glycogen phosphorylase